MKYYYQAYGIQIISTIVLPALFSTEQNVTVQPIIVVEGKIPELLQNTPIFQNANTIYNEQEFSFEVPGVARYYVANGVSVTIEPISGNMEEVLLYFYSNCFAFILFQRSIFPFHVSGVFIDERQVLLLAAASGTGKSTTAIKLKELGYTIFTDDTAAIFVENKQTYALASYPIIRLKKDSINYQDAVPLSDQFPLRGEQESEKFGFYFHKHFYPSKAKVAGIVFLENNGTDISIKRLKHTECIPLLSKSIYRKRWLYGLNKEALKYKLLTEICQTVPAFKASRPENTLTFNSFASAINSEIIGKILIENKILP